jgi:hypothetical protein
MAKSRLPGPIGLEYDFSGVLSSRTPGSLGLNDAADPSALAYLGHSPGPLGFNDAWESPLSLMGRGSIKGRVISSICIHPVVVMPSNAMYTIPQPCSTKPPLISDSDITEAAANLRVEPAAIYAVSKIESGGRTGFDSKGRPKILFEARWFHKFTFGQYDKIFPHLSQATWGGAKKYYSGDQWTRLAEAFGLNAEAALKSASWGKFQVMGFNHNGFDDVFKFCTAMFVSEREHLQTFLAYCKDNSLVQYLKSKDWAKFAQNYNGPQYKENQYDKLLEKAYNDYKKKSEKINK